MYLVTDCAFNRENYPALIGQWFANPPAYAMVVFVTAG